MNKEGLKDGMADTVVLGVVGTRNYTDPDILTGVDSMSVHWAKKRKVPYQEFPPKTKTTAGYYARNQQIVDAADILFAFPDSESKGTYVTIRMAKAKGIPVVEHLL